MSKNVNKSFGPSLGGIKIAYKNDDMPNGHLEVIENDRGEWEVIDTGQAWCLSLKGFGGENTLNIFISYSYYQVHVLVVETCCADGAETASCWVPNKDNLQLTEQEVSDHINKVIAEVYSDRTNEKIRNAYGMK